jgi:hypothetical protein
MINRVTSLVPKTLNTVAQNSAKKGSRLTKFLQSETLGKVLDTAKENEVVCQSLFSLALCVGARPVTNFIITEDKGDAAYASGHSIASGVVGFAWPLIFATPLAKGMKKMISNPAKYFKPELVKKFYPNVGTTDVLNKEGKKVGEKIMTNVEGKMLRKDGSVLIQSLEPKMVYGEAEKAAFEATNKDFYIDKGGVVRSKKVFSTKGGKVELDAKGNPIGCAVQSDMTPITEEMKIGSKMEQNLKTFVNMVPDIMLAPPRAALTIAVIPPILKGLGLKKKPKDAPAQQKTGLDVMSKSNNTVSTASAKANNTSVFSSMKKGGV